MGDQPKTIRRIKMATAKHKLKAKRSAAIDALSREKSHYAEKGDVNSCGDWLAVTLRYAFRADNGSFDLAAFKACLKDNGLHAPKVDMDRHGAIGRFRMCAGLMLRRRALEIGHVIVDGKKIV